MELNVLVSSYTETTGVLEALSQFVYLNFTIIDMVDSRAIFLQESTILSVLNFLLSW